MHPRWKEIIKENISYTLPEWRNLVEQNPDLLQVEDPNDTMESMKKGEKKISHKINMISCKVKKKSTNNQETRIIRDIYEEKKIQHKRKHQRNISNISNAVSTLDIDTMLKERTSPEEIMKFQEIYCKDIIQKCLESKKFETTVDERIYMWKNGIIYTIMPPSQKERILVPEPLEGTLIVLTHMKFVHMGLKRMRNILDRYYFPTMVTKIKNYMECCYRCFLNNPQKAPQLGPVPIPDYPGQVWALDFAENLNDNGGKKHILVAICLFSNLVYAFPTSTKTAGAVIPHIQSSISQLFAVEKIISDNGPAFSSHAFLKEIKDLSIKKIQISAFSPQANNSCEKAVGLIKLALKKLLTTEDSYAWKKHLPAVTQAINSTPSSVHGYSPLQLIHGKNSPNSWPSLFRLGDKGREDIFATREDLNIELLEMWKEVKQAKLNEQEKQLKIKNKNRPKPKFDTGDYVYRYDHTKVIGVSRPLHSRMLPNIYIVLENRPKSLILKCMVSGNKLRIAHRHVKRVKEEILNKLEIPDDIKQIFLKDFQYLTTGEIQTIAKNSEIEILEPMPIEENLVYPVPVVDQEEEIEDYIEDVGETFQTLRFGKKKVWFDPKTK